MPIPVSRGRSSIFTQIGRSAQHSPRYSARSTAVCTSAESAQLKEQSIELQEVRQLKRQLQDMQQEVAALKHLNQSTQDANETMQAAILKLQGEDERVATR
jgi:TolA-binding protein